MARGRSKSVVQKIASDAATQDGKLENLVQENEKANTKPWKVEGRSQSTDRYRGATRTRVGTSDVIFDAYPLTSSELSKLSAAHVNSYNHEIIIPTESIQSIQSLTDDSILSFQSKCQTNLSSVSSLILQTNDVIDQLDSLTFKYDYVTRETSDFASKSQTLITKKQQLEEISSDLSSNLEIFESLDSITKILTNTPGINVVKKQSFHQTLFKLDNCLYFMSQHENYKEAPTYNVRFRQCMTRALTLIRNYLIEDLKELQKEVSGRLVKSLQNKGPSKDANSTSAGSSFSFELFLYTLFNEHIKSEEPDASHQFQDYYNFPNLSFEIFKRIDDHQEYIGLYNDVLNQYFKIRSGFLNDYIWNQIDTSLEERDSKNYTLVQFTQNNLSFFKKMLYRELEMFQKYFSHSQLSPTQLQVQSQSLANFAPSSASASIYSELIEWFKSLLEPLYDTLRNKIIREVNISTLCEVTTLLQKYYEFEEEAGDVQNGIINFGDLFEPILQDVQARLIFRIQLYTDEKLLKYKAKPEDLNVGNRRRGDSVLGVTSTSPSDSVSPSSLHYEINENLFPGWFLPIGKAFTILSNIYQLINSIVFDDLAHYIVHSCIIILKDSAYKLALLHLGEIDAKLYLLKNLILLQQQLNHFDIQYIRTETSLDFTSGIADILGGARNGDASGGVFEIIKRSVPKVVNNMMDAKYEIESELANTLTDFIKVSVDKICEPLESKNADILKASLDYRDKISKELPKINHDMQTYLNDIDGGSIINHLMDTIFNQLILRYEQFYVQVDKTGNDKTAISDLMEVDTLYGFLSEVVNEINEPKKTDVKEDVSPIEA